MKKKTPASPAKRRLVLGPPPKLPPDVEELFAANDFEELTYRRMAEWRKTPKRTPAQKKALAEHEAFEQRMAADPDSVMREAHEALDHGTSLLLKLIRSRKSEHRHMANDGSVALEWDQAFSCLSSRLDYLNRQLVRLADKGVPDARTTVFFQAKNLSEAFIRLAQAHPSDFIGAAEASLTMPSLRARNPKFTADAEVIAKAIHLAEKHPAGMMTEDKERIGELCGWVLMKIVESINWARRHYCGECESLQRLQNFRETEETYRDMTIEDYLRRNLYPTTFDHVIACAALPELRDDPIAWWKQRVKTMLREEFERLKRNPALNLALWTELGRSTDQGTAGARWKALSDNCRNKLNQLARRATPESFE